MRLFQQELSRLKTNPKQWDAYIHNHHCIVLAGPGSGKTATLTLKIMSLLEHEIKPPHGIACITYNNEAVHEFKSRLKRLGMYRRSNIFLGTVHSFCRRCILAPFSSLFGSDLPMPLNIASDKIRDKCFQKAMDGAKVNEHPSSFRKRFDVYRRTFTDRSNPVWRNDVECSNAIEIYEKLLHSNGYVDFDDLILYSLDLLERNTLIGRCLSARYPWLIIDEYQDLGYPLHKIVLSLLHNTEIKLFAVGDPDQSIYGFAGANPKYLDELSSLDNVKTIRLELNYRSGQRIIDSAEIILAPTTPRKYKSNKGQDEPGEITFLEIKGGISEQAEKVSTELIPDIINAGYELKEIAILYIDYHDGEIMSQSLQSHNIKYAGPNDGRYRRTPLTRWIENIAQWSCQKDHNYEVLFSDISDYWINFLDECGVYLSESHLTQLSYFYETLRSIGQKEISFAKWLSELDKRLLLRKRLYSLNDRPDEIDAMNELLSNSTKEGKMKEYTLEDFAGCGKNSNTLTLTTLHSSKGLQFDVVIIPGLEEGRLPAWHMNDYEILESRRTFYVGFTRARFIVYLLYSGWYVNQKGNRFNNGPTKFLVELQEKLKDFDR